MTIINNYFMAAESAVKALARRIGKDIGKLGDLKTTNKTSIVSAVNELKITSNDFEANYAKKTELTPLATKAEVAEGTGDLANLPTTDKTSVVASINEVVDNVRTVIGAIDNTVNEVYSEVVSVYAKKSELTPLATKVELTQAITNLINGANTDSDTLKELADKITALAQADKGLVSTLDSQEFNETQKKQARDNINAAAKSDIPDISGLATKAESDVNYHKKAVTYTRTEMDGRYAKVWTGTLTQYNGITTKDANTIYIVT